MSKPSRKLSLRKETVRQLGSEELAHVGGGVYLDWVIMRFPTQPPSGTTGTEPPTYLNYNLLRYW